MCTQVLYSITITLTLIVELRVKRLVTAPIKEELCHVIPRVIRLFLVAVFDSLGDWLGEIPGKEYFQLGRLLPSSKVGGRGGDVMSTTILNGMRKRN